MNIPDMEYHAWRGMANACDEYVAENQKQADSSRNSRHRGR